MTDETTPEEPTAAPPMCLDPEVSEWLIEQARDYFDGSVERAMNHHLTSTMRRYRYWSAQKGGEPPTDPWTPLEAQLRPRGTRRPLPRLSLENDPESGSP